MIFKPHQHADNRKRSAVALIKLLLKNTTPEILPAHLRELLDKMLWKITEADGKYNTRYRSESALHCNDNKLLAHEHVYPKEKMITALIDAKSEEEIDRIVAVAVGCTVTRPDHSQLHKVDNEDGWNRYRKAGIVVMNIETGERVI